MKILIYRVGVAADLYRARRYLTLPAARFPGKNLGPSITWRWRISRARAELAHSIRTIRRHVSARQWHDLRNTLVGWRAEPDPFPPTGLIGCGFGLTRQGALIRLGKRLRAAEEKTHHPDHLVLLTLVVKHLGEKAPQ